MYIGSPQTVVLPSAGVALRRLFATAAAPRSLAWPSGISRGLAARAAGRSNATIAVGYAGRLHCPSYREGAHAPALSGQRCRGCRATTPAGCTRAHHLLVRSAGCQRRPGLSSRKRWSAHLSLSSLRRRQLRTPLCSTLTACIRFPPPIRHARPRQYFWKTCPAHSRLMSPKRRRP
jgi:hypothetical protein